MKRGFTWKPAGSGAAKRWRNLALVLLCALLAAGALTRTFSNNLMRYLLQIFLYISLGEAWNLLSGYAGLTSLGQQLYVGLAGYAVAVATSLWNQPFWVGLVLGVAVSVLAACLLTVVFFRMKGMYFAIATWVAAEAAQKFFLRWKYVNQGGGMTIRIVPYPDVSRIYILALILCVVTLLAVSALLRSKLGLGLMAMRDDPDAAASIGVNLYRTRFVVCLLAAVFAALAGGIFFINKGVIYPESGFHVNWTVSAVFIGIIGGVGTVSGPIVGAVIYVLLQEFLAHYPGWSNIMLGLITILVIQFLPGGVMGLLRRLPSLRKPRP